MDTKIGLIGCGAWGSNHARVWREMGALAMVCDANPITLERVTSTSPGVRATSDPQEVFADPEIAGVVIATPAPTHHALAREAMSSGKHVYVEKPMATTVEDAEDLESFASEQEVILMVGHILEYHPAVRKLGELLADGALGKILYAYSNRLNFGRIRTAENAMWSFAPHDIALLMRLLGGSPTSVSTTGAAFITPELADTTLTTLTFESGVKAHIYVSWLHPFKEHRFVIVGSDQMAVFDDTAPWAEKISLYPHRVDWTEGRIPVARKAEAEPVPVEEGEPLQLACEHFLESIASGEPPLTDGRSGVEVLRVLGAAQASLEAKGSVQAVPRTSVMVHPTATVDPGALIGDGTRIWHYSHVMGGAEIGKDCVFGQNVFVANTRIGDGVKIQNNVSIYEGVELEDGVFCGPAMTFTNVTNPRSEVDRSSEFVKTLVKKGATLGANCTVLAGVTIGSYALVGAGAVVTRAVPAHGLVHGVPAKLQGWVCTCGLALAGDPVSSCQCGRSFEITEDRATELSS